MPSLITLFEKVMIDKLLSAPAPSSGLERTRQFFYTLAAVFLLTGLMTLIYGVYIWLSMHYTQDQAVMITAFIILGLACLFSSILIMVIHYHKARIRMLRRSIADKIKSSLETLEHELGDPIRNSPKMAITIAACLGFLTKEYFVDEHAKKTVHDNRR